jgi:predicted SAM-dependent methyltransferase
LKASALSTRRLHLGCGIAGLGHGAKIYDNWTNIDIEGNGLTTFAWDLATPLPLPNASVQFIYSEHFIEHLSLAEGRLLLSECRRLLMHNGVLRMSTPDLVMLARMYVDGNVREWADMGWEPLTPCDLVNEGMRCWGHQYVYDESKLTALLRETGFRSVTRCAWRQSTHEPLTGLETRPYHGDLIVEASA